MKYKMLNVIWDENAAEASVVPTTGFYNFDPITQLDALKDAMGDLDTLYNELLKSWQSQTRKGKIK